MDRLLGTRLARSGGIATTLIVAAIASFAWVVPAPASGNSRAAARQTKQEAEIILLSAPRKIAKLQPALVNPQTRLLRTNTRASCQGIGRPIHASYRTFRCVVHHDRTRLLLRYTVVGRYGALLQPFSS